MRCRQLLIPAAVLAMVLALPWGHPRALGGTYTWGPIVGYGYYISYDDNQFIPFSTGNGEVTIGYDPDNLDASYIDVSTGSPGYGVSDLTTTSRSRSRPMASASPRTTAPGGVPTCSLPAIPGH